MKMNKWQWNEEVMPGELRITQAACRMQDSDSLLTWNWPGSIRFVLVEGYDPALAASQQTRLKLYTREEYKANGGYRERLDRVGRYAYRIYPGIYEDGAPLVYRQEGGGNEAVVSTERARIRCSVRYGSAWLRRQRTVQMTVTAEIPVPKEALCYVKKTGAMPLHKDDGIAYPLLDDLTPGVNRLAAIEVGKDDNIKLFFTDGKTYGSLYELIHE
jgi:hypothetical protein